MRIFEVSSVEGRRKAVARELGARALRGSGFIRVGEEEVPLEPGRYVLVEPEATRQVVAGPEGLSYAVVGAVPA